MLTPQQYRRLGELLAEENLGALPHYSQYLSLALSGELLSTGFLLLRDGRLCARVPQRPEGGHPHAVRLRVRALVRLLLRAACEGFSVSFRTQEWLRGVLRASDMIREACDALRPYKGSPSAWKANFL